MRHDVGVRDQTLALTALSVLAALCGLVVLVAVAKRRQLSVASVVVALCVSGAVVIAGAMFGVLGVGTTLGVFGLAHLAYLSATVAMPMLGAGVVALGARSRPSGWTLGLGALMVLPAPVGLYATHVAPFRLQVDRATVTLDERRDGSEPVTVGVLSDLQTTGLGDHERAAVDEVMAAAPDVIVLPGDLFQADHETLVAEGPALRDLLARLDAPGGVYFVRGDVDRDSRVEHLLEGTGVVILDDRVERVHVRDRTLLIGGTRKEHASATAEGVREELRAAADAGEITILLSHRPDTVLGLPPDSGVDLTIAGHTHGGQIAVPGFGPLTVLSNVPREVGAGGLHEVRGNRIYVSTGVGMERGQAPQIRLFVPPSVGLLTLTG